MDATVDRKNLLNTPGIPWYIVRVSGFLLVADMLLIWFTRYRLPFSQEFAAATLCLNCYLACFFLLGHRAVQHWLNSRVREKRSNSWLLVSILLAPYLIYASGTRSFRWLALGKVFLYLILPTSLVLSIRTPQKKICWQDAGAILLLWLPLDFRWMWDVWSWPRHSLAYSMNSLLAVCIGVFLFVCVRQLQDVGYEYRIRRRDIGIGLRNFLLFAPLGISIGLMTQFISLSERFVPSWGLMASAVGIFVVIAVPEEFLFRGLIQNFLEMSCGRAAVALVATSLLFGAAHLNNGPRPDWRYFVLASLAGLFYGDAYNRTRNLVAPAIVHTLVDAVWRAFFH
jgi:membrane protease YdiL (CAAX protease family)